MPTSNLHLIAGERVKEGSISNINQTPPQDWHPHVKFSRHLLTIDFYQIEVNQAEFQGAVAESDFLICTRESYFLTSFPSVTFLPTICLLELPVSLFVCHDHEMGLSIISNRFETTRLVNLAVLYCGSRRDLKQMIVWYPVDHRLGIESMIKFLLEVVAWFSVNYNIYYSRLISNDRSPVAHSFSREFVMYNLYSGLFHWSGDMSLESIILAFPTSSS